MLYTETVEVGTLDLIKQLTTDLELDAFNLVGGTALSLQIGHRISVDIDLFTHMEFDAGKLADHLTQYYNAEIIRVLTNGIFCFINNIKVDLIAHRYPILHQPLNIEGVRMLGLQDIAAMKLHAILNSGSRLKDFVDIFNLLEKIPLRQMTDAFEQKYSDVNKQMAQNALLYHHDIDHKIEIAYVKQPVPWDKIAERLRNAVANEHTVFDTMKKKDVLLKKNRNTDGSTKRKGRSL